MEGSPPRPASPSGLELRVERQRAVVRFAPEVIAPGVTLEHLTLEVPRPGAHIDVGAGPSQFRHVVCDLDTLELGIDPAVVAAIADHVPLAPAGLAEVETAARPGFVELAGRVASGARFTCRLAPAAADGDAMQIAVLDARVHALSGPSAATLAIRIAAAIVAAGGAAIASGTVATLSPIRQVLLRVLPQRGFELPRTAGLRLASVRIDPDAIRLGWARLGAPPRLPSDPELVATLDGIRTFAREEALLATAGEAAALDAWLALPQAARGHPFAASRILSLLCADPERRDEARALANEWLGREPDFPPALLAEGLLATSAGDAASASRAFAALARGSLERRQELAVLAATDACCALGADADPAALASALEAALEVRRSHLAALRSLHELGRRTLDRAALLRACRGIVAHAVDPLEKARAHARLAVLLAGADRPAARMHLEHALRLGPDAPETQEAAARLGSR